MEGGPLPQVSSGGGRGGADGGDTGAQICTLSAEEPLRHPGKSGVQRKTGHPCVALLFLSEVPKGFGA